MTTPARLRALASKRGGELLLMEGDPDEPTLRLRCERGHAWRAPHSRLLAGRWCPRCRKTIEDFDAIVGERGVCVELLSRPARCVVACTTCAHVFDATFSELLAATDIGRPLCPRCDDRRSSATPSLATAQAIARGRGGSCVSCTEPLGSRCRLRWHCACGHEWAAPFSSVVDGEAWCPRCTRESPGAAVVHEHLERLQVEFVAEQSLGGLGAVAPEVRRLRFDFYVPLLRLAIEFDGRQHVAPCEAFGGVEAFVGTMRRDELKREWCLSSSTSLLRVPHDYDEARIHALIDRIMLSLLRDVIDDRDETAIIVDAFYLRRLELLDVVSTEGSTALVLALLRRS
jgi:hypothetical protein